jgi:hypothetical protein
VVEVVVVLEIKPVQVDKLAQAVARVKTTAVLVVLAAMLVPPKEYAVAEAETVG